MFEYSSGFRSVCAGILTLGAFTVSMRSEPIISEIVAENQNGYSDDDLNRSDWIELFNPDESAWSLKGWTLSDDPSALDKWQFPDISIGSKRFLVVFASGKDRSQLGAPLHTNFRLAAKGEFLALTNPEGQSVSSFEPSFPKQFPIRLSCGEWLSLDVYRKLFFLKKCLYADQCRSELQ